MGDALGGLAGGGIGFALGGPMGAALGAGIGGSLTGGGGSDPSINYASSPQQTALYNMFQPILQNIASAGTYNPNAQAASPLGYDDWVKKYGSEFASTPESYNTNYRWNIGGFGPLSATGGLLGGDPLSFAKWTANNNLTRNYTGKVNPQSYQEYVDSFTNQNSSLRGAYDAYVSGFGGSADGGMQPGMSGGVGGTMGGGLGYPIPDPYELASMSDALAGADQTFGYGLPDASTLMPTRSFFESIDPSVMEGMNMMYDDSRNQMFETLGASGLGGSARGGFSGTAGAALGEFQANKARNMMQDLFNMSLPGMAQGYQSQLDLSKYGAGQQVDTQNFQRQLNLTDLMNQNAQRENIFNMQAQSMKYPYDAALSVMGATLPNPVVNPGSPGMLQQMLPTLPLMAMAMK